MVSLRTFKRAIVHSEPLSSNVIQEERDTARKYYFDQLSRDHVPSRKSSEVSGMSKEPSVNSLLSKTRDFPPAWGRNEGFAEERRHISHPPSLFANF